MNTQTFVEPLRPNSGSNVVGVLALQGAFDAHCRVLKSFGADVREVKTAKDLEQVHALFMPGGESTTMSRLLGTSGLRRPLASRIQHGMPVFGTCAGMILLASKVLDGRPDQESFDAIEIKVRRNGYGRQIDSFEAQLDVQGVQGTFPGVFIRAPKVEWVGPHVQVLAQHDGVPVMCAQANVVVASFHPEISGDARLHQWFIENYVQNLVTNTVDHED